MSAVLASIAIVRATFAAVSGLIGIKIFKTSRRANMTLSEEKSIDAGGTIGKVATS